MQLVIRFGSPAARWPRGTEPSTPSDVSPRSIRHDPGPRGSRSSMSLACENGRRCGALRGAPRAPQLA